MRIDQIMFGYGCIITDNGGCFDLEGTYFVRSFPALHGPSFGITKLREHLKDLKCKSIGPDEPETCVIINGIVFDTVAQINELFEL